MAPNIIIWHQETRIALFIPAIYLGACVAHEEASVRLCRHQLCS